MKSINSTWFECTVKYDQLQADGLNKKVIEKYTVDALSFTEAESVIIDNMKSLINGDFSIKKIDRSAYSEVFFADDAKSDKYFKLKVAFITLDDKTGAEKKTFTTYLVQSDTPDNAIKAMRSVLGSTMQNFEIVSSVDAKIQDVFKHN